MFRIRPVQLLCFICAFILFTAIGTVSHEFGHIIVARCLGYNTTLHSASMNYDSKSERLELSAIFNANREKILKGQDYPLKQEFLEKDKKFWRNDHWITLGGPLQTMLTGTVGLLILFYRKRHFNINEFVIWDWLAVFLSLFWLREIFNLLHGVLKFILKGNWGTRDDESRISLFYNLPPITIPVILGVISLCLCAYVVLRIVPAGSRFTFIAGGLIGGMSGFVIWISWLGPMLLP
jgi:hypothetical protein